ncbi:DUF3226 domain-containing protein [Thiothrix subterranea]|uniref:DUF3226 domain-containing protein n=1 Tax=Thiothrix subterranea TaxID=2735563 RepID=A0AA51ML03_9GAMM|nr:DUF3226 domain-containing protein [Thiothrix subterranea]MDQ5770288.1 DUF3226 domain-containing protein [Thiothrix subterranea]WML85830.1 DUF3226 domain-containing protein [Thiothrix subterranea]
MSVSNRVLLVEGEGDKEFIQRLICTLKLDIKIMPETPRDICNTQSDGIDVLRTRALPFVLDRIRTENITHLGIIIDADSSNDGYGFEKRRKQITDILIARGYKIPAFTANINQGEIFPTNKEDWSPIGLWIMPTHSTDGMLEDLLLDNLNNSSQQSLLSKADAVISDLGDLRTFKDTHLSKARLSTLLAWQKKPGTSAGKAYQAGVFAADSAALTAFTLWLQAVFQ